MLDSAGEHLSLMHHLRFLGLKAVAVAIGTKIHLGGYDGITTQTNLVLVRVADDTPSAFGAFQ